MSGRQLVNPVLVTLAFLVGGLLAVQGAANVQLSRAVRSPLGAATLQLGIAATALILVAAVLGTLGAVDRLDDVASWHLVGGLASAAYISAGIILFPRLGALVTMALFVAGQMVASVVLDGLGLLGLSRAPVSTDMVVGALAVIAGMTMILTSSRQASASPGGRATAARPLLAASGLLAGAGLPVQAAVNAHLRTDLDAPFTAAAISFVVATAAVLVILAVAFAGRAVPPDVAGLRGMPWWGWLGGLVGASYVTVSLLAVPQIGAAPTIALSIAGQQLASALVDHAGLFRLPRRPLTLGRIAGVVVLLWGAVVFQLTR
jgi:bacterial/archaeal transporter family-2 protein